MKTFHNIINVLAELCDNAGLVSEDVADITNALAKDKFFTEEDADYVREYVCETVAKETEE